ncbi:hypothetical protein L484_009432 [Morus notabilis]|uniref:Uncharacterized protein n=1 Tax=Morus notabilis TaxID=981085 RepID=W9QY44_9ROSA|nr:hypothetical protein L484_009432 [Morus notabilis]
MPPPECTYRDLNLGPPALIPTNVTEWIERDFTGLTQTENSQIHLKEPHKGKTPKLERKRKSSIQLSNI